MARALSGLLIAAVLTIMVAAILLLANFGDEHPCVIMLRVDTASCLLRTHKEIAAGVIGTAGAIFAAWIAWTAVQRQIEDARELATSRERETMAALRLELDGVLKQLEQIWTFMEVGFYADEEGRKFALDYLSMLPRDDDLKVAEQVGQELGPLKRRQLTRVLTSIRAICATGAQPPEKVLPSMFQVLGDMFGKFRDELARFDPEMAEIFKARKPADLREIGYQELMATTAKNFEKRYRSRMPY